MCLLTHSLSHFYVFIQQKLEKDNKLVIGLYWTFKLHYMI